MCSISHKELYLVPHWLPPPPPTIPLLYTAQLPNTHQLPDIPFSAMNYVTGRLCHCDENQEHQVNTCDLLDKVLSSQPYLDPLMTEIIKMLACSLRWIVCLILYAQSIITQLCSLPDVSTSSLTYSAAQM